MAVSRVREADRIFTELGHGCVVPLEPRIPAVYRPVEVYDSAGLPWPGTVTGWWTSPDGRRLCRLRLAGSGAPRWVRYDPDRIALAVHGGT